MTNAILQNAIQEGTINIGFNPPKELPHKIEIDESIMMTLNKTGVNALRQFVSEEMKNTLAQLANRWKADKWAVGDIANGLVAYVEANRIIANRDHVYEFVSEMLNSELTARTVRYYARISEFFPQEVDGDGREGISSEYSEVLSHSHFSLAIEYKDHWREILDKAMSGIEEINKPYSVDWLRARFCNKFTEQAPPEVVNPPTNPNWDIDEIEQPGMSEVIESESEEKDEEESNIFVNETPRNQNVIRACIMALKTLMQYVDKFVAGEQRKRILGYIEPLLDEINSL